MVDRMGPMSKATVTRLFIGANLAVVAGLVVLIATVVSALAGGAIAIGGPNVIGVDGAAIAGAVPWLIVAVLVAAGGALAAVGAWIGALFNTARLDDKTWFVALLALGLLSFGWIALVAYIVAGPDGTTHEGPDRGVASASPI